MLSSYSEAKRAFFRYCNSEGFGEHKPFQIADSDSSRAFVRSINTTPAYRFYEQGEHYFGSPRVCMVQPVVRPEDFLAIDTDCLSQSRSEQVRRKYRCGYFDMAALWQTNNNDPGGFEFCNSADQRAFYSLLDTLLRYLRDILRLDPARMWFTLWPGGTVADGEGTIPKDESSQAFLLEHWGAGPDQISWDPSNIWPDPDNQGLLDPGRTGLIGPRVEVYYGMQPNAPYPKSISEADASGFMELVSAIPILWINDRTSRSFKRIPPDKTVSEAAFGLERAIACVEGAESVYEIAHLTALRSEIETLVGDWLPDGHDGDSIFSKICDRLRFVTLAAAQGVSYDDQGRGRSLKRSMFELIECLRSFKLNNLQILEVINEGLSYCAEFEPDIALSRNNSRGDFVQQQLSPQFVLGKKYDMNTNRTISERDVVLTSNRSDIRQSLCPPEATRKILRNEH